MDSTTAASAAQEHKEATSPGKRSEGTVPGCSTMRADAVRTPGSKHVVGATGCFELRDWVPVMRHGEDPREAAKV